MHPKSSELKISNTLSGKKELFKPLNAPFVGMYVCGPTVYSDVHLGNVRTFTTFDMVRRYLSVLGYKVRYVRNITDVGHLLDNDDEDKISKRARIEKVEPMEIVQKYTVGFHDVMKLYNNLPPDIEPSATGHIIEQISMIERIIDNGFGYESNGSVYFDVNAYAQSNNYGILSGRKIEDLLETTRDLDGTQDKRSSLDFALWKKADETHIMRWPSPWSEGFPGWHLECSVMSTKYLGKTFDIHGGGMDLKFPHHECEIAQSVGADKQTPVNYWMHGNMLTMNGTKMSKSLGNVILPEELVTGDSDLLVKGFSPMTVRFFILQSHYASTLDFSNDALLAAEKGFSRLMNAVKLIDEISVPAGNQNEEFSNEIISLCDKCYDEMNDDFNTAKAIAVLFEFSSIINAIKNNQLGGKSISKTAFDLMINTLKTFYFDVLGLRIEEDGNSEALDGAMKLLIELRSGARADKDWALTDKIRDDLSKAGIILKDEKGGQTSYTIN